MRNKFPQSPDDENPEPRPNSVAIVAIVTEVVERRNETIFDIPLQSTRSTLLTVNETAPISKAAAH